MTANKLNDMIKTEFSGNHDSKFPTKHEFQDPLCPDYSGFSLISAMKELFESKLECKVKIGDIDLNPFSDKDLPASNQTYSLYFRGGDFVAGEAFDEAKVKPALYVNDYKKTLQIPNPYNTTDSAQVMKNIKHFPLSYNSSEYSDTTFGDPVNTFPYALGYRSDPTIQFNPTTYIRYYNINCSTDDTTLVGNAQCSPINIYPPTMALYLRYANYRAEYQEGIPFAQVTITATPVDTTTDHPNGTYTVLCADDKAYSGLNSNNGFFDRGNSKIYVSGCVNRVLSPEESIDDSFDHHLRSLHIKEDFNIEFNSNAESSTALRCVRNPINPNHDSTDGTANGLTNDTPLDKLASCVNIDTFYSQ